MTARAVGVLAFLSLLLAGLLAAPASAQAGLQVTASVTGGPFVVGNRESIPVKLTVTNSGTEERRGVKGRLRTIEGSPFYVRSDTWRDLDPFGAGAVFAAGETRTYDLIGHVSEWAGQPRIMIGVQRQTPNIPEIAETEVSFQLVPADVTEHVGGQVFQDANENRVADPGEELPGITVRLAKGWQPFKEAVTGADGRFAFPDIPVGFYELTYGPAPGGWLLPSTNFLRLDGTGTASDLGIRARRPMSENLRASVALDRKTYSAGDSVQLTVTLTNTGQYPLTGLVAGCDRYGSSYHLLVTQEAWGELAYGGPGATVQPGQTRVFAVTGTVPDKGDYFGLVSAICDFVDDELYLYGAAEAAPVYHKVRSSKTANTFGTVYHDKDGDFSVDEGEAVVNTRIGLRDVTTGRVTVTATTDATGRIDYTKVPVGRYTPQIFGPWKPVDGAIEVAAEPYTVPFFNFRVTPRHGD
ncbi:hypothetical protein DMH04_13850 [Kibdelosporangium aridum]|uniref:Alpha-amylase n=2 Tax=Kibdelosporangium aridum TaxID=2030 RepID=A0A428ZDY9_KIBAR|nr:hypothetical protein DMH04_13850 [Kibdelosporangium aridum]